MITENFFTLAEGECGVPITFDQIDLNTRTVPATDSSGQPLLDENDNPITINIDPTFFLQDKRFVTLEFNVADVYPTNTSVEIIPSAYIIQKPNIFVPQTTVKIKSKFDFGGQVLLQLNIKSAAGDILYTDYQIIIIGDGSQRNCQKAVSTISENEDIILSKSNLWQYIYNDHLIAKLHLTADELDNNTVVGKLLRKNKDILPVRLPSEDIQDENCSDDDPTTVCKSKQIAEIPSVAIVKRTAENTAHKIGELVYNKKLYNSNDTIRVDINNKNLSGIISDNLIHISGEYFGQHLLSYSEQGIENIVLYTNYGNPDVNIFDQKLTFDFQPHDDNHFIVYSTGIYRWDASIIDLPIAILNKGIEHKIEYSGVPGRSITFSNIEVSTSTDVEGAFVSSAVAGEYDFIRGVIEITVKQPITDKFLSYYVLNYGYMGGNDKLVFAEQYRPTPTPTPTATVTPTVTPTPSVTPTLTPTPTITPTASPTLTATPTTTNTPSVTTSITPTTTSTPTTSITPTITPTISITPSQTPTITITPSVTPSNTPTISLTPSITPTISITPSITPTNTPTASITPTLTYTPTTTPTISSTPTITPTASNSPTPTPTITVTPSQDPDVPGVVRDLQGIRDELQNIIDISWLPPSFMGTSPITQYRLRYKLFNDLNYTTIYLDENILAYTIDISFNPVDTWIVEVCAVNNNGFGINTTISV